MTKVLLVEDHEKFAAMLTKCMRDEGFTVVTAADGEEGLSKVKDEQPDVVILDIMLPKLDGLSLCRMIQRNEALSHIPVIMLTARESEIDKIIGFESGADDYIVKANLSLGEFLARVRAVLRRIEKTTSAASASDLITGDLRLNLPGRRLFRGEQEVHLSNKEFELLVVLMQNPDIVLSRDLLLTKVWGDDYFVDKRTVDVHIRWLREKIEEDPSNPTRIVTVRGVGYRFEE